MEERPADRLSTLLRPKGKDKQPKNLQVPLYFFLSLSIHILGPLYSL